MALTALTDGFDRAVPSMRCLALTALTDGFDRAVPHLFSISISIRCMALTAYLMVLIGCPSLILYLYFYEMCGFNRVN